MISKSLNLRPFLKVINLDIAYMNLDSYSVITLLDQVLFFEIPVQHLNLSGNNVGPYGCKGLNLIA
jgi:hypothetical protein